MLPLKPQPVVLCTKDVQVKALEELLESLIEKPVSYSWAVNDCTSAGTCILWTILADQVCKFWPLKVSSTVSEEDCRKFKSVNHGYQAAMLFHPVGTCSPERTSIVTNTAGKGCADHVTQLIHRKACILRVLTNVDTTSLQCMPAHFGVEGKVPEARMPGKPTIIVHHQVLKVVTKGDRTHAWCSKVRSPSRAAGSNLRMVRPSVRCQ